MSGRRRRHARDYGASKRAREGAGAPVWRPGDTCRCGKHCFDERGARGAARRAVRETGAPALGTYQCPVCGLWHLTSKTTAQWRHETPPRYVAKATV